MSASVRVETIIKFTDLFGNVHKLPFTANPETAATGVDARYYTIADAAQVFVWDPLAATLENTASFGFLAVVSDGAVDVEFICDDNAGVGKNVWTHRVTASLPFMLGADDSYANPGADDAFSGTIDLIERITIKNSSGASRVVLVIIGE